MSENENILYYSIFLFNCSVRLVIPLFQLLKQFIERPTKKVYWDKTDNQKFIDVRGSSKANKKQRVQQI